VSVTALDGAYPTASKPLRWMAPPSEIRRYGSLVTTVCRASRSVARSGATATRNAKRAVTSDTDWDQLATLDRLAQPIVYTAFPCVVSIDAGKG
jgi:hypothetical protein